MLRRNREAPPARLERAMTWSSVFSTYLPALILALGTGIALPAVAPLAKSFDVSFGTASLVVTAFLVGTVLGAPPAGWLVDRFGRRSVLIAGPILTSATALLVTVAHSFPELVLYRFLGGIAAQMWLMARMAAISANATPGQRGRQVSWMFGMDNTGKLVGPLAGGLVASEWGLRAPFLFYGVLALVALVPAFMLTRDEAMPRRVERKTESAAHTKIRIREIVRPRLPYFGIALFAGLTRGPIFADLLHVYAVFAYHLSARGVGILATAAGAIALPVSLVAGWVLDRFGRRKATIPGFLGVGVAMAALAVSAFAGFSLTAYVVLFLIAVLTQSLTGGSIQTIGADMAPPEARGRFLGLWRFTGQAGQASSPLLFSLLAFQLHYGAAFLSCALTAWVVAYLAWRHVSDMPEETAD